MKPDVISRADFPALDKNAWEKLARKALKDTADLDSLVSYSDDGIPIEPIYGRARLRPPGPERSASMAMPQSGWHMVQRIDHPDPAAANAQAREDLAGGATGLALIFAGAPNAFGYGLPSDTETLGRVLDGIALEKTHIRVDTHPDSRKSADWIVDLLTRRRTSPAKLSLSMGIDSAALFGGTGRLRMSIEALRASMPQSLAGFFALDVPSILLEADGRVYHNAGASHAQELGAMLSAAIAHMRMVEQARQPLVYATPHIGFSLSVDQDQLFSIAKIRALRSLWTKVQQDCSIDPSRATIHAETSWFMLSAKDCETNILRNTIAAFSAVVGGADSLAVLPHTAPHGLADGFARRVARNTQRILADESHLGFVEDPTAGAGGFEALTEELCAVAWKEFQKIEAEGGILESLRDGHLQSRIASSRNRRNAEYASGRRHIVGMTMHPLDGMSPVHTIPAEQMQIPSDGTIFCERLVTTRQDELLENRA